MIAEKALLFPFTDVTPSRLAGMLSFFQRIIVYRLPIVQPGPEKERLSAFADQGRIVFEDVNFFENRDEPRAIVADFQSWAGQFRDVGYLSLLKGQLVEDAEKSPSRLIQSIRGRGEKRSDPDREAQIYLHLAEGFDRQQDEVDDLISRAMKKETLLGDLVGVEDAGEEFDTVPPGPALTPGEGSGPGMMGHRLAAWGRVFQKYGASGLPLVTDHQDAMTALDINLARRRSAGDPRPGRETEIIEPLFELPFDRPALQDGASFEETGPGPVLPRISAFIDRLASKSWSVNELDQLRKEAEGVIGEEWGAGRGEESLILKAYLLPGRDLKEAFLAAAGPEMPAPAKDLFCGPVFELKR